MSGIEFELHCLRQFLRQGWEASVTKGSGDQGADIIASKNGRTVVVQCKHYATPVGNSAVQEVYAAKAFVRADTACVVSNAPYTPRARQIAAATEVLLLNEAALQDTDAVFGIVHVSARPKKWLGIMVACPSCGRRILVAPLMRRVRCCECGTIIPC